MKSLFNDDLRKAISKKDGAAILSLFQGLNYGLSSITPNTYYDAIMSCDERYRDEVKNWVTRALLLKTRWETYPIIEIAKRYEGDTPVTAVSLMQTLDPYFSKDYYSYDLMCMICDLEPKDASGLETLLKWIPEKGFFENEAIRQLQDSTSEVDHVLISYAVKHSYLVRLFYDCYFTLGEIQEDLSLFSEEEVFAMVFVDDYLMQDGYVEPSKHPSRLKDKELLLRLGFELVHKDSWATCPSWVEKLVKSEDIFVRLMAIKVISAMKKTIGYTSLFEAFAGISPMVYERICADYAIFPCEDEERSKIDDFYDHDLFSKVIGRASGNYWYKYVTVAFEAIKRQGHYIDAVKKLYKGIDESINCRFYAKKAIETAIKYNLDHDFIQKFAFLQDAFDIDLDQKYYVKCYGGDAVAEVKICVDSFPPAIRSYIKDEETSNDILQASGCHEIYFVDPYAKEEINPGFKLRPVFEVVNLTGSVYGRECHMIKNNGHYHHLFVGYRFKPDELLHFYPTAKMAQIAPLD